MVKHAAGSMDAVFAALADPTRRAMLERLALGPATVSELAAPFAISLPAISKHLRVLAHAGLLVQEKDGRLRRCHLEAGPLLEAVTWLARYEIFWDRQLDALSRYLTAERPDPEEAH